MKKYKSNNISEYELKREKNIQRNLDIMKSLGIAEAKSKVKVPVIKDHPTKKKTVSKVLKVKVAKVFPHRQSSRLQGIEAEFPKGISEDTSLVYTTPSLSLTTLSQYRLDAGPLKAECLNCSNKVGDSLLESHLSPEESIELKKQSEELPDYSLHENDVAKVVPDRIYSVVFRPSSKVLVCCGDKSGHIGLWSPDDASEEEAPNICVYRPHIAPVSGLLFDPDNKDMLTSSSYDGTVRVMDMHKQVFLQVFATPENENIRLTSLIFNQNHNYIVCSCDDGYLECIDKRINRHIGSVNLHEKKINTVHQHPNFPNMLATASLDRTVCLWDDRKFKFIANESSRKNLNTFINTQALLSTLPHYRSVNCGYFSPNGDHFVTVAQDNYLHVYNGSKFSMESKKIYPVERQIPHDNQTGRWISKFHASWDPKHNQRFIMGSMRSPRCLEIFSPTCKQPLAVLRNEEVFRSIHSINTFHPFLNFIAGGNSSGRMCLWRS